MELLFIQNNDILIWTDWKIYFIFVSKYTTDILINKLIHYIFIKKLLQWQKTKNLKRKSTRL
jgi:hypothetical protein